MNRDDTFLHPSLVLEDVGVAGQGYISTADIKRHENLLVENIHFTPFDFGMSSWSATVRFARLLRARDPAGLDQLHHGKSAADVEEIRTELTTDRFLTVPAAEFPQLALDIARLSQNQWEKVIKGGNKGRAADRRILYLGFKLSKFNHSCEPNTTWTVRKVPRTDSFVVTLKAKRNIKAGEEVTVSYLSSTDLHKNRIERREKLSFSWHFDCMCSLCVKNE